MNEERENNNTTKQQFLADMVKLQGHLDRLKETHKTLTKFVSGNDFISREAFVRIEDSMFLGRQAADCAEDLVSELLSSTCLDDEEVVDANRARIENKVKTARSMSVEASKMFSRISNWMIRPGYS